MKKLALALVIPLTLGLVACGDDDDDDAVQSTTTTTAAPSTTSTSEEPAGPALVDAAATARTWVQAVASGDDETAVGLLSARSLEAIGGPDGYQELKIALSEGWGAWGRSTDAELTEATIPFPKDTVIVVFHGEVSQEGPPQESWNALPVVATEDGDRVEPFVDLGSITVEPPEGSTIDPNEQLFATTTGGYDTFFIIDDGDGFLPNLKDVTETGAKWFAAPDEALSPGLHALTVVVVHDGVMAQRFEYRVS